MRAVDSIYKLDSGVNSTSRSRAILDLYYFIRFVFFFFFLDLNIGIILLRTVAVTDKKKRELRTGTVK